MTKALSLTVFAERSNVTDGRTDINGITIGDLMLRADALASVAKNVAVAVEIWLICHIPFLRYNPIALLPLYYVKARNVNIG